MRHPKHSIISAACSSAAVKRDDSLWSDSKQQLCASCFTNWFVFVPVASSETSRSAARMGRRVVLLLAFLLFIAAAAQVYGACISDQDPCQPDGSLGNCCSGYCHKEPGWDKGFCRPRIRPGRPST